MYRWELLLKLGYPISLVTGFGKQQCEEEVFYHSLVFRGVRSIKQFRRKLTIQIS